MARIATTTEAVLAAIQSRVAFYCTHAGLPSSTDVYLTLASEEDIVGIAPNDRFVTISPRDSEADQGVVAGGGILPEYAGSTTDARIPVNSVIEVSLWVRFSTDSVPRDSHFLLDQTNGVLKLWRVILRALQLYDPTDSGGAFITNQDSWFVTGDDEHFITGPGPDLILSEPMRLLRWSHRPRRPRIQWGKLESFWDVRYVCSLENIIQAFGFLTQDGDNLFVTSDEEFLIQADTSG